jgi:hypothetical protein
MSALLTEVLQRACESEPPPGDAGDATADIVARAERLRRRRALVVLVAAVVTVAIVILLGYALTTVLLPGPKPPSTAAVAVPQPRPSSVLDPVLAVLAPHIDAKGYRIEAPQPASGSGWRRYVVHDAAGAPRGMVEVVVFDAEAGLCLPVLADPAACALPDQTGAGVEYARYADTGDVDWQVNQVIARRVVDGRTVAVMATGERGTGSAEAGEPPLNITEVEQAATDPHLQDAFGVGERCNRPAPTCPILRFPVRPSD